jgi:hypothetical protein
VLRACKYIWPRANRTARGRSDKASALSVRCYRPLKFSHGCDDNHESQPSVYCPYKDVITFAGRRHSSVTCMPHRHAQLLASPKRGDSGTDLSDYETLLKKLKRMKGSASAVVQLEHLVTHGGRSPGSFVAGIRTGFSPSSWGSPCNLIARAASHAMLGSGGGHLPISVLADRILAAVAVEGARRVEAAMEEHIRRQPAPPQAAEPPVTRRKLRAI